MKVVLDTNVWISGLLLPKSIPGQIIAAWQHALFKVVISPPILDEIERVLSYPKIQKRLTNSSEEIKEYLSLIRFLAEMIEIESNNISENKLRDNNDLHIISTLIASQADYLITGDQDLLVLNKKYPIISPNEFSKYLN